MSLFDLIEKGVKQIDAAPVDIGIVVINFKNRLPHDQLFRLVGRDANNEPVYAPPRNEQQIIRSLYEFGETRLREMVAHVSAPVVANTFAHSKALPGVFLVSETGVPLFTPKGPAASLVGITHVIHLETRSNPSRFSPSVNAVFRSLNDAMHLH